MTVELWAGLIVLLQVVGLLLKLEERAQRRKFQVDLEEWRQTMRRVRRPDPNMCAED
jgi:hypothetical protein